MLEAFLSDFSFIKETLDQEGDHDFFGRDFSFFSSEPTIFYRSDKDLIVYANEKFLKKFGYNKADLENASYSLFALLSAEEKEPFITALKEISSSTNNEESVAHYHVLGKDKSRCDCQVKTRRLQNQYYIIQFEDCVRATGPGSAQEQLEHKIEELNKSNLELEEFAYVASHDMQEPLRKISTFGQRLKSGFGDVLGEDGNMYLTRMLGASENMRNLIDNLLEFSRVSRNKQPYEKIELGNTLKEVIDDLDMRINEAGAQINLDPAMPEMEAIPSQMRQLFFNLLQNAIKFRKKDTKLSIDITCRNLKADELSAFQLTPGQQYYLVKVADNGIGFEQQYAERIFQLFQRLEGKSEYPGTGIGLSICRKIVSNHAGQIFAESEPGKGTAFSIILPEHQ